MCANTPSTVSSLRVCSWWDSPPHRSLSVSTCWPDPAAGETAALWETGCRNVWLKQLALAFQVFCDIITIVLTIISLSRYIFHCYSCNMTTCFSFQLVMAIIWTLHVSNWSINYGNWRIFTLEDGPCGIPKVPCVLLWSLHLLPAHTCATPRFFHRCECSRGDAGGNLPHTRHFRSAGMYSNLQTHAAQCKPSQL